MGSLDRLPRQKSEVCINIFASHNWGHGYRREDMHALIEKDWVKNVDFRDFAISRAHPIHNARSARDLMDVLARIIGQCDVFLVFAGMEAAQSLWMEREVIAARVKGVPVLAVVPFGAQRRWSVAIDMADEVVHWRGDSIRNAILQHMPREKALAFAAKLYARQQLARGARYVIGSAPGGRQMVRAPASPASKNSLSPSMMINALRGPRGY